MKEKTDNCYQYNINDFMIGDAEGSGRLIRLPCKVGSKFYVIDAKNGCAITHAQCAGYVIAVDARTNASRSYVYMDSLEPPFNYWKIDFDKFNNLCFENIEDAKTAARSIKENA